MKKQYLITLIIAVIVGTGAFFGGMTFQKKQDSLSGLSGQELTTKMQSLGLTGNGFGGNRNINGNGGFPGGANGRQFGGGGVVSGDIVSVDPQSITVKQQDGSTKTVYYSSSTTVNKTVTGSTSELTTGTRVRVTGTANTDGSVTATEVQLNPVVPQIPSNSNTNASTSN